MDSLHLSLHPQARLYELFASPVRSKPGIGGERDGLQLAVHYRHYHPLKLKQGLLEWGRSKQTLGRMGRTHSSRSSRDSFRVWGSERVRSSYESSSGDGSSHLEDDGDSNGTIEYVEARVMDAVSMVPLHGKLLMTLANGREQEVDHINPSKGRLLYKTSTPTMFLKVTDGSDLMLPIVVGEGAVSMLMKALHDEEHFGRPSCYHLMKEMVGALKYEARMVRITKRVVDTYYARIFLGKKGEEEKEEEEEEEEEALLSIDARPSDAINFAVRCKVPIFINRRIITADAVRPVLEESGNGAAVSKSFMLRGSGTSFWEAAASEADSFAADEAALVMNMLVAATEERYADAAHWRDELSRLRKIRKEKL
jgi:bifunctional DNase/RNase